MALRFQPLDWYDAPRWYDIVFDADSRLEADFLESTLARFGPQLGRRVLEPACGTGRLVAELCRRGYEVTGFDLNPHMLRFARQRLKIRRIDATLDEGRLERFAYDRRFDLAHCLVSTFKYLLDEESARSHLRHVASVLVPGGLYVLGFHLSEYDVPTRTRERWVGTRGGTTVVCNIQQWPPNRRTRRERVRSRLLVRRGRVEQRFETQWEFRAYSARQVKSLLRAVPDFVHVATYDFTYDERRALDGEHLDVVLILQRRNNRPGRIR